MRLRRFAIASALASALTAGLAAQGAKPAAKAGPISPADLKEWLTFIASDQLQGRRIFTEGLGTAADYVAEHLKQWGVQPAGENGTYFQTVKVLGVKSTSHASVTVEVNGQSKTFNDGEGITFPRNMGGKQTVTADQVQFVGYGLQIPDVKIDDYAGVDAKGKVIIYMGAGPANLPAGSNRLVGARGRNAIEKGAVAVINAGGFAGFGGRGGQPAAAPPTATPQTGAAPQQPGAAQPPAGNRGAQPAAPAPGGGGRGAQPDNGDFTTVENYNRPVTPSVTAQDAFLEFLFSGADVKYADLKTKATAREPLSAMALKGVKMTFNVDPEYTVVRTQLSKNVVGIIPGTDAKLKDTYVGFGAHYDHVGYRETPPPTGGGGRGAGGGGGGAAPGGCTGQERRTPKPGDITSNGADDDGSGTVTLLGLAKAFATGPKPKRSLLLVWHTGEESGLWGSRYNADFPVVPLDKIVAVLNTDMVGRNRCDDPKEENTVYLVGSDRISTELHNLSEDTNAKMSTPMKLDYEMNDPADPESIYTRSDHYSYAAKGIPIIFYTTGLHRDYHQITDEVEYIEFPKMAHIAELMYRTGMSVANLDHAPARDNRGPRVGKGTGGKIK